MSQRQFIQPISRVLPTQEARELAMVMLLPIPTGIYAAFILAGGLATIDGVLQVGVLIFGGNAAAAIILSKFHRSRMEELKWVGAISSILLPTAALTAIFAPTIQHLIHESLFSLVTAGVILLIAIQMECETLADYIPRIELLGLLTMCVAGVSIVMNLVNGVPIRVAVNAELVIKSIGAAVVGSGFVTVLVVLRRRIQNRLNMAKLQTGCAIALTFVALDLARVVSGNAAIIALIGTVFFSLEPTKMATDDAETPLGDGSHRTTTVQQDTDPFGRTYLRDVGGRLSDRGRVERYCLAGVLITVAGTVVAVDQVLGVSNALITAGFATVFTVVLLAMVIVLTVDRSDGPDTDEFIRSSDGRSSLEQWRRGRRRP